MQRPFLLSHQAAPLANALAAAALEPRTLTVQPPHRRPGPRGWGVLPAVDAALIVDFTGRTVIDAAMLLTDLRRAQRQRGLTPLVLVPRHAYAVQRLLAASQLAALVLAADAPPSRVTRWLAPPLAIGDGLVWVDVPPIGSFTPHPHGVPFLAALAHADTVPQAAAWCGLSGRRAYELLQACAAALHLPRRPWRVTKQWVADLSRALAQPPAQARSTPSAPIATLKEGKMTDQRLDLVAATLCGCTIEHLHVHDHALTLDLDEPRQGRLTLTLEGGLIRDVTVPPAAFAQRPAWARKVDWVDVCGPNMLDLVLTDGVTLAIHFRRATCTPVETPTSS